MRSCLVTRRAALWGLGVEEMGESLSRIRERHAVLERDELLEAIHASGGNISQAARRLGRSRGAVYRLIQKHDIALQS